MVFLVDLKGEPALLELVQGVDVFEIANPLLEVDRQLLEQPVGGIEHQSVYAGVRLTGSRLAGLHTFPLHHACRRMKREGPISSCYSNRC